MVPSRRGTAFCSASYQAAGSPALPPFTSIPPVTTAVTDRASKLSVRMETCSMLAEVEIPELVSGSSPSSRAMAVKCSP